MQAEDEYMISDFDLFVTKYISVPKDMGQLNCAAFIAGIVKGALDGAGFPARWVMCQSATSGDSFLFSACHTRYVLCLWCFRVTAHFVAVKGAPRPKTTILMKFDSSVLLREQRLPAM